MTRPQVLMFGATGQVARAVRDRAPGAGAGLTVLSRADADLTDSGALRAAIENAPDGAIVVNAAAYTAVDQAESEPELAEAVNATAPGVMAEACAARGLPLVHVSTDYVFDGDKSAPYLETDPTNPQSVYGRTKLAGERAVLDASAASVIVRTSWVYSPYGKNFLKTMLRVGAERDELSIVDDQIGAPTSAHDIADGLLAIAAALADGRGEYGVFHLTAAGEASWADFAEAIFEAAMDEDRRPAVRRIPTSEYPTPATRPANSRLDCGKLERVYGFRAPDWRDGLARVLEALDHA